MKQYIIISNKQFHHWKQSNKEVSANADQFCIRLLAVNKIRI